MPASPWYRPAGPHIIGEVMDGEAILVNLDSGAYYSLCGSGAVIWECAAQGASTLAMLHALAAAYAGEPEVMQAALEQFLRELENEALLTAAPAPDQPENPPAPSGGHAARPPFAPPALEKYTDMADLLLLDPIHEVDETGWPRTR